MQHTPEEFACPVCKQMDRVEKVSAVYEAGTSTGAYSGGTVGIGLAGGTVGVGMAQTNLVGSSQTNRSLRLAPPPPPPAPAGAGCFFGGLLFLFLIIGLVGVTQITATTDTTSRIIGIGFFVACLAGSTFIIIGTNRRSRIKKAEYAQKLARWRQAIANWERLYYCSRNDVVFIPGNAETCLPAYELYKLL